MPRVPCRSARQQLTAAACSALFRVRTPASARPDGLRRLPQQHSGRVLRRVCHARMRWCARLCTLRRMRRISLRHYEKKPALRQRRPRGAGRPALKWPMLRRPARPLFCAPPAQGAPAQKSTPFLRALSGRGRKLCPRPAPSLQGRVFRYASQNKSFLHGPGTPAPPAFFYNQGPALSAWRTQGLRVCITGKPLNRRQN